MGIYEKFAKFYTNGPYPNHSRTVALRLPDVFTKLEFQPQDVLDIACGEGSFAVYMATTGYTVTGIDLSPAMLHYAQARAAREDASVTFIQQDMRYLSFESAFDLATCWFDSLNYMLTLDDLERVFKGVARALRPNGMFLFDMNTIYGLAITGQKITAYVEQDTEDTFLVHRITFDYERSMAAIRVTGFCQDEATGCWDRMDETHHEHAYPIADVKATLGRAGLEVRACWGSFITYSEPKDNTGRVWFVAQRPDGAAKRLRKDEADECE